MHLTAHIFRLRSPSTTPVARTDTPSVSEHSSIRPIRTPCFARLRAGTRTIGRTQGARRTVSSKRKRSLRGSILPTADDTDRWGVKAGSRILSRTATGDLFSSVRTFPQHPRNVSPLLCRDTAAYFSRSSPRTCVPLAFRRAPFASRSAEGATVHPFSRISSLADQRATCEHSQ